MFDRYLTPALQAALSDYPAVALLGARQVGKTTLARQIAKGLMIDAKTVHRYIDMLGDLMLLRKLPPWHRNLGKRLVKSPKLYVRDSGLLHALLGLASHESLLAHPMVGTAKTS